MTNEIGGSMTDKIVDVGSRHCRTSAADIFLVEFSDVYTNVDLRRRPEYRRVLASVGECRPPTLSV